MVKFMKGFAIAALGLSLIGCNSSNDEMDEAYENSTKLKMNTTEVMMFERFNKSLYTGRLRTVFAKINLREQRPSEDATPFCDVVSELKVAEADTNSEKSIKMQWFRANGESLSKSCNDTSKVEEESKESQYLTDALPILTDVEKKLLSNYYENHTYYGYDKLLQTVIFLRDVQGKEYTNTSVPFCDALSVLAALESEDDRKAENGSITSGYAISLQWKTFTGEDLETSCGNVVQEVEERPYIEPTEEQVKEQVIADTVTVEGNTLLSPDKIREVTAAAKDCGRAKNKLLDITESGKLLTVNDYEDVTLLILKCENLKMQVELNN